MRSYASALYSLFQENQPIQWTGAISHTVGWVGANVFYNDVYPNPSFKKKTSADVEAKEEKKSSASGIAIYCVHGTADVFSAFGKVVIRMLPDLPEEISCIRLVRFKNRLQGLSIEDFAEQLVEQIKKNGDTDIFLMGHSRGSQVIESIIEKLGSVKIHGILSIGGPYGGSWLAVKPMTFFSESVAEMQPGSDFLKKMQEKVKQSPIPHFYYAAENDHIVMVEDTFVAEHKNFLTKLDRHGHLSILSSRRLVASILRDIKKTVSDQYVEEGGIELTSLPDVRLKDVPEVKSEELDGWEIVEKIADAHPSKSP